MPRQPIPMHSPVYLGPGHSLSPRVSLLLPIPLVWAGGALLWGQPGRSRLSHTAVRQRAPETPRYPSQDPLLIAKTSWALGNAERTESSWPTDSADGPLGLMTPTSFMEARNTLSQVEVRPLLPSQYQCPSWRMTSSGDMSGHRLANKMHATKLKMLVLPGLVEHQNL